MLGCMSEVVPERVAAMAAQLVEIPGVVAVVLGGSRATGQHRPDSDFDLGLYYRDHLDMTAVRALAATTADRSLGIADPGGWGPWVNGGAWLEVGGTRVDWIYRDLARVERIWADCCAGRYEVAIQPGHPLGYYSHIYAAEVALCRVLADPSGALTRLAAETRCYPDALAAALVTGTWEAEFLLYGASTHGVATGDTFSTAGLLFRLIGVLAHALHGHHRAWVTHEKRLVDATGRLASAPPDFAARAHRILGHIGTTGAEIAATAAEARSLVDDTLACLPTPGRSPLPV